MLKSKIVHFKQIYKFYLDHFFVKCMVCVLIKEMFSKIKSCVFRPNNARYEKMLTCKIVHLKETYTILILTIF